MSSSDKHEHVAKPRVEDDRSARSFWGMLTPRGSKYPNLRYPPKIIATIPNIETLQTSHLGAWTGLVESSDRAHRALDY